MNAKTISTLSGPQRFFIFGPAGIGKTYSIRTLPKPTYVIDCGDGMSTNTGQDIDYDTYAIGRAASYRAIRDRLIQLSVKCDYKSIVIDELTSLSRSAMNQVYVDNGNAWSKNRQQDYFAVFAKLDELSMYLVDIREKHKAHIVVFAHEYFETDKDGNKTACLPIIDGKKFPGLFLVTFDELYHMEVEAGAGGVLRYVWRTKRQGVYQLLKTRIPGLLDKEVADFSSILAKAEKAAKELTGGK